jgi:pilus assembly protein CpaB
MNRSTRTFIVLVVAIGAAAAASFGVYRAISSIPERRVEIATKHAVVAAVQLPLGRLLTRESVKLVPWPASTPLEGGFDNIDAVLDRGVITNVALNEPITELKLAAKGAGAGLPPTITPGMRAISIKVTDVTNVAGFVIPGTHVDVVVVIEDPNTKEKLSRVAVSNVQVLTSGTLYDQEESRKAGKAIRAAVITLMVSPVDAERVALAQNEGQLTLTLRNPLDVDPTASQGVRTRALWASQTPQAPASAPRVQRVVNATPALPPAPVVTVPSEYRVETFKAAKKTETVLESR